ncbi:MAG: DEAD/DEAH box helicase, partial [Gemmatimonadaceae bacterium]
GVVVAGSDHLTAYNLYAEAYSRCGSVGEVYGLPRHLFDERIEKWAERRGVLVKAIEDTALGMASVFRALGLPLPASMILARDHVLGKFTELLARFMPFDLVIDEETADGMNARVSRTSVCGSWGAIAGEIRYFADRSGTPRAAVEGTQIPMHLIRKYATRGVTQITYDPRKKGGQLVLTRTLEYFSFELERETEPLDDFSPEIADRARRALAEGMARGEVRHAAVKKNRASIDTIRDTYRRSGGTTPRLGFSDLTSWYERQLAPVQSMDEFRNARFPLRRDEFVPADVIERFAALPSTVEIRDREIDIDYDVEERDGERIGVARLRLPEKLARTISEAELPVLDRPLRFVVIRGQRGAIRADSLDELQEILERPWSPDELDDDGPRPQSVSREERRARELAAARKRPRGRGRKPPGRFRGR